MLVLRPLSTLNFCKSPRALGEMNKAQSGSELGRELAQKMLTLQGAPERTDATDWELS